MSDFHEKVNELATRSKMAERQALTEEATKTAVVMPLLQALGYDVFSLDEVTPEFNADVGTKKGEKVDFAVKIDGQISMLVEVKPISSSLGNTQYTQLFRYFSVTEARLALLTNGREIWFFSDTEKPNKMDMKPFFKFDLQKHDIAQIEELARFQKNTFDISGIIEAASNLKYIRKAANYIKLQLSEPDEDFLRLVGKAIYEGGSITKAVLDQMRPAVQRALDDLIRERIQDKLSITFSSETSAPKPEAPPIGSESDIETTEDEIEAYNIVRAIGAKHVKVGRITIRDAKSYCAILMDDNNRRPICRFYFNAKSTKSIGIFDKDKAEKKFQLSAVSDIYDHLEEIEDAIKSYV